MCLGVGSGVGLVVGVSVLFNKILAYLDNQSSNYQSLRCDLRCAVNDALKPL